MKKLHRGMLLAMLCLMVCFSSCYQARYALNGAFVSNCKQFGVGSVCFHNPSGKTITVEMKDYKVEVLAFSTICMDLYEGDYKYKVKKKGSNWKDQLEIVRCKEQKIELAKCKYC